MTRQRGSGEQQQTPEVPGGGGGREVAETDDGGDRQRAQESRTGTGVTRGAATLTRGALAARGPVGLLCALGGRGGTIWLASSLRVGPWLPGEAVLRGSGGLPRAGPVSWVSGKEAQRRGATALAAPAPRGRRSRRP